MAHILASVKDSLLQPQLGYRDILYATGQLTNSAPFVTFPAPLFIPAIGLGKLGLTCVSSQS
jgi:hypothetical protein